MNIAFSLQLAIVEDDTFKLKTAGCYVIEYVRYTEIAHDKKTGIARVQNERSPLIAAKERHINVKYRHKESTRITKFAKQPCTMFTIITAAS